MIIFLLATRNNLYINILNFRGVHLFRTSGGQVCYIKDYERRVKKSKEVLSFLAILSSIFLKKYLIRKIAFIFKHRWSFSKIFIRRLLRSRQKKKLKLLFVGRSVTLAFGGCRAGKRRNFRSERKKRFFSKRWNRFKSVIFSGIKYSYRFLKVTTRRYKSRIRVRAFRSFKKITKLNDHI